MRDFHNSFVGRNFLRSLWAIEYEAFKGSDQETQLGKRLVDWASRADLKETTAEGAFIEEFFRQTWGYIHSGQDGAGNSFSLYPKFHIGGAGARGGPGEADLAIGYFEKGEKNHIPQVVCEFKDIKSALDAPQKSRKGGLSPVKQCLNYLSFARRGMFGNEPVLPQWGIVTDMNEFRLYWHDRAPQQYLRFIIRQPDLLSEGMVKVDGTLNLDDDARFDRFLFWRVFHRETLLTPGGKPLLLQLVAKQWIKERELEKAFYAEYRAYRERLYLTLLEFNPRFPGTRGALVRLAQKILDRCIFIFFCEDMGAALRFPPQLLRDFLIERSRDQYFEPNEGGIWREMKRLFRAMNLGDNFGPHKINQFNGGLFADDPALDSLEVPNFVFCQAGQGQDEGSLYAFKQTLLYFSASYNYAGGWAEGLTKPPVGDVAKDKANAVKSDPSHSLGLYTLGRIFEQSITELEILEAEADGRPSLNKEGKRKRDGVYYTPEWVVERVVHETLGPRLAALKDQAGWPKTKLPNADQIDAYRDKLEQIKIVDPACGSGAFLITTLRYLLDEMKTLQVLRQEVTLRAPRRDDDALVRDILRKNIYGVDINPASVEIARLALWLHTARGDKPLSSLEGTIKEGNSLIGSDFYKGQVDLTLYDADQRERLNTFDWEKEFPDVFAAGGFDAVVGNPPYVKLQNFSKVHSDAAKFLREGRPEMDDIPGYASAKTGNFDLYLPFIEKGLSLLNEHGRLGYIAPSVWVVNEYGEGLRELIVAGKHLEKWLDFKSFQIFEEATTYTALQFFTKSPNDSVAIAYAPNGSIADEPFAQSDNSLTYDQLEFEDRWLMIAGPERNLISKLQASCSRLGDEAIADIFQGVKTGADPVYKLEKIGPGRYLCSNGEEAEFEIEDAIMRPIVSGYETQRYRVADNRTHLLFPYVRGKRGMELLSPEVMKNDFPLAWKYLSKWKTDLEKRDGGDLRDDHWYRFSRSQSLDQVGFPKLYAAGTVKNLQFTVDQVGALFLTGGRVDGVRPTNADDLMFLLGVLNSKIVDFVFRRLGRVKANGWFEANKQFIAPLPIARGKPEIEKDISDRALRLLNLHSKVKKTLLLLSRRADGMPKRNKPELFLFPTLLSTRDRMVDAPVNLDAAGKRAWSKIMYDQELSSRYDAITQRLVPGSTLSASFEDRELRFLVDGVVVLDKIFLSEEDGAFIASQWKAIAGTFPVSDKTTGKKLCNALRKLATTNNEELVHQFIELQAEIEKLELEISAEESALNGIVYKLYRLTKEEIRMVESA